MTIFFNFSRKVKTHFEEQKLIDIQSEIGSKINQLLNPFSDQLNEEPSTFINVNYFDEQLKRPFIEIFNIDGDTKMNILSTLQCLYNKV